MSGLKKLLGLSESLPAPDCWHEPYMSRGELARECEAGGAFSGFYEAAQLLGPERQIDESVVLADARWFARAKERRPEVG